MEKIEIPITAIRTNRFDIPIKLIESANAIESPKIRFVTKWAIYTGIAFRELIRKSN